MRLTYANVTSSLALFVALSGGAYAATALPRHSVGTKQLKVGAVTSAKVRDGSLTANDFRRGRLPAGPRGPQGRRGPQGERGPAGTPDGWTRQQADGRYVQGGGTLFGFAVSDRPYGPAFEMDGFRISLGCLQDGRYRATVENAAGAPGPAETQVSARFGDLGTAQPTLTDMETRGAGSYADASAEGYVAYEYDIRTAAGHEANVRFTATAADGRCRVSLRGVRYG